MTLRTGKLDLEAVERFVLNGLGSKRSDVVVGPRIGVDCAVVDAGGTGYMIVKSDPITFATERVGWYAVHVNANDIVTAGADPAWFLSTVLVPPDSSEEHVSRVFRQIDEAARSLGVAVVGGHTEVTATVNQIVIAGTMVGHVERGCLLLPDAIRPGDQVVVTKGAAVEATAIVADSHGDLLRRAGGEELPERGRGFLDDPGISVVPEARLVRTMGVRCMHDATEGGVRAAIMEMAMASGCGVRFMEDHVPVHSVTRRICSVVGIDPLAAISSGCLLIAVGRESMQGVLGALADHGITAAHCGEFLEHGHESYRIVNGEKRSFPYQPRDEVARLFDEAG